MELRKINLILYICLNISVGIKDNFKNTTKYFFEKKYNFLLYQKNIYIYIYIYINRNHRQFLTNIHPHANRIKFSKSSTLN